MIWLNGQQVDSHRIDQAAGLFLDDGLLYGRGVFETIRVGETPYFWVAHCQRLNRGLAELGIRAPIDPAALLDQIRGLAIRQCVLRLTVTASNLILQTRPLPNAEVCPARLMLAAGTRTTNLQLLATKNLNYLDNLLAWEAARQAGFDDAVWLNPAGWVAEASRANLFWISGDRIRTPDLACGLLNGVVRQWVTAGFTVQTGQFPLADLLAADAVFLTGSVAGIRPVASLLDRT